MRRLLFWVVRLLVKPVLSARVPVGIQRRWGSVMGLTLLGPRATAYRRTQIAAVPCMMIEPPNIDRRHCVLYLHGGAYVMGGFGSHRKLAAAIGAAAGARVCLPQYRLAPEYPYPAALDDALAVYSALLAGGQDPNHLCVAGDSAGGGLSLALALAIRAAGLPMPAALVLLSPWVDMTFSGDTIETHAKRDPMIASSWGRWAAQAYCADTPRDDPACSPLFAPLGGLAPILIQVGSEEVLLSDARRLHQRAQEQGLTCELQEFAGLWHVFQLHYGLLGSANQAIDGIGEFVRAIQGSAEQNRD